MTESRDQPRPEYMVYRSAVFDAYYKMHAFRDKIKGLAEPELMDLQRSTEELRAMCDLILEESGLYQP